MFSRSSSGVGIGAGADSVVRPEELGSWQGKLEKHRLRLQRIHGSSPRNPGLEEKPCLGGQRLLEVVHTSQKTGWFLPKNE